jgi:hypothetical protein
VARSVGGQSHYTNGGSGIVGREARGVAGESRIEDRGGERRWARCEGCRARGEGR